jgi:hypothetical protein
MNENSRKTRRNVLIAALCLAGSLIAGPAYAGSYLDRAAILVTDAGRDADYLRGRLSDKELARVIHTIAEARVTAASTMQVPKEVAQAHPHLLLVLENYERAAESAQDGNSQRFLIYQQRARDEEKVLRGVLKQLGWSLPDK